MFLQKYKTYTKNITIDEAPTKKLFREAFLDYKPENPMDWIITALISISAENGVKKDSFDGPGRYSVSITLPVPVMLWNKVRVRIRKIS